METFRTIAFTACFLGIAIAVFNSLYPSEKFAGQLKIIFSLIFILSLVKPIASGKVDIPEIAAAASAASGSADYYSSMSGRADEYFIRSVENNISSVLESSLHEIEIYPEEIKTSINISENYGISINEVKIVLNEQNAHEAEAAKRCVSDRIGNTAAVTVNVAAESGKEERQ